MDYANAAAQTPYNKNETAQDISPFQHMGMAVSDASGVMMRVRLLADRLTGAIPTPIDAAGGKAPSPQMPPVFHALRVTADQLRAEADETVRALDRIERMLP